MDPCASRISETARVSISRRDGVPGASLRFAASDLRRSSALFCCLGFEAGENMSLQADHTAPVRMTVSQASLTSDGYLVENGQRGCSRSF